MNLERKILIFPGYDKRSPDPAKNYGIHNMVMQFAVIGPKGAVTWNLSTGWYPLSLTKEVRDHDVRWRANFGDENDHCAWAKPWATDLGYHSRTSTYEGQYHTEKCHLLDGDCYYDGSSLQAEELVERFLLEGLDYLWPTLEARYKDFFKDDD